MTKTPIKPVNNVYKASYCSKIRNCNHGHDNMLVEFTVIAPSEDSAIAQLVKRYPGYNRAEFKIDNTLDLTMCNVLIDSDESYD